MKQIVIVLMLILTCTDPARTANRNEGPGSLWVKENFKQLIIAAQVTVIFYPEEQSSKICIEGEGNATERLTLLKEKDRLMIVSNGHVNLNEKVKIYIPVDKADLKLISKATHRRRQVYRIPEMNITISGRCNIQVAATAPGETCISKDSCSGQTTFNENQQTSF
ncbi:MAG TPA: hypothetical protein PLU37_00845 [Chitinophagaceae bacterium]|nr:hypothetical protein [Chitinophagaceae bacterium]HRX93152.1 hypothetical protein [Chitinophagaceae bacterium]